MFFKCFSCYCIVCGGVVDVGGVGEGEICGVVVWWVGVEFDDFYGWFL